MFTGLKERDLPKRPHVCIASDTSFERVLNVLGQVSGPRENDRKVTLSYGSDEVFGRLMASDSPLFATLEPTPLDRRRMDLIAKAALPDAWLEDLGERQILLKGRGGVGKTVILLQMAYRAFDRLGQRSLVLTFNRALVADMRRTMALLGVPRGVEKGGVAIETVHGFIGRLMMKVGVIGSYDGFLDDFDAHKATLLAYLDSGAIKPGDVADIMKADATEFDWDLVFVDEGQDWPADEIAILNAIYGSGRLVVSDGVDQFVRESVADWSSKLPKGGFKARRLRKCLRMKANLAVFVADIALTLGLDDWDLEPNADAAGGRVIVVEGNLAAHPDWMSDLMAEAKLLGNYPVDLLACVPPGLVTMNGCDAAAVITDHGGLVWDGTARDVREHYPSDREQLRFVQYDSCRGLEGWTTFNYRLDELFDHKVRQWLAEDHKIDALLETHEEAASRHAARWIMIPLTRAIDTLVINVGSTPGPLRDALVEVAARRADFVQWINLTGK